MSCVTVLALDPGGTTGWAVLTCSIEVFGFGDGTEVHKRIKHKDSGEIYGEPIEQADEIGDLYDAWPDAAIVIEHFQPRQAAYELSAIQAETICEYIAFVDRRDETTFKQLPALAMTTATNERLKRWGLYKPGSEHSKDAMRHAITFLRRASENTGLAKTAWPFAFGPES